MVMIMENIPPHDWVWAGFKVAFTTTFDLLEMILI
jgi:hypothetical protein